MSRSVASLSLTLGVAIVTLAMVGGILAAPSIRDCAAQDRAIAACLRDKLVQGAVIPQVDDEVALVSGLPAAAGWMDVYAPQHPGSVPASVTLTAAPGELDVGGPELPPRARGSAALAPADGILSAAGRNGGAPQLFARVALAEIPDARIGSGTPGHPASGEASVLLAPPIGTLRARGNSPPPAPAAIARAEPASRLSALGVLPPKAPSATASLAPQPGIISATGGEGVSTRINASAAPDVIALPPPAGPVEILTIGAPRTGADAAASTALQPIIREAAIATDAPPLPPEPPAAPPQPRIVYDPAFPNVLVLPSPATGRNSSIVSLTLD